MFPIALTALALALSPAPKSIVDLAVATPDLSTLVAALKAGDLVDTLAAEVGKLRIGARGQR